MYSRLLIPPKNRSFFLFGPRGTGESTWARANFQEATYIDLLDSSLYATLLASPGRLAQFISSSAKSPWVIVDEVQRIPELLNEVHRLIEGRRCKFVLTGSSARGIRKRGVNLLAGRAVTRTMHPLTALELGTDFNVTRALRFGTLPIAVTENDPADYLKSGSSPKSVAR